jgi:hypothetical protein
VKALSIIAAASKVRIAMAGEYGTLPKIALALPMGIWVGGLHTGLLLLMRQWLKTSNRQ